MKKIRKIVILTAGVALIALATLFSTLGFGNFGFGKNKDSGADNAAETSLNESEDEAEMISAEYFDVSVSENEYLFKNSKVSLEELINELTNIATNFSVKIADDNASQKAYRELVEALEEHNIQYMEDSMK